MKRLLVWAVLVVLTWWGYHVYADRVTTRFDAALLGLIAVVSFECVLVMLIWTWRWRAFGLGLLSFFLATGLLYLRVSSVGFGHGVWQSRINLEIIRALYLDAALLAAIGLNPWALRNRHRAFPYWRKRNADGDDGVFGLPKDLT